MTISHAPDGYECPFCFLLAGGETEIDSQSDVVLRTERATAFVASGWWANNRGHVIVIPNAHHENIYDLPAEYGHAVHDVVREIAVAMREAYGCEGISTRQHNEPAGGQDAWHFHVHVIPRYHGDDLHGSKPLPGFATGEQRRPYADKLLAVLRDQADGRQAGADQQVAPGEQRAVADLPQRDRVAHHVYQPREARGDQERVQPVQ